MALGALLEMSIGVYILLASREVVEKGVEGVARVRVDPEPEMS